MWCYILNIYIFFFFFVGTSMGHYTAYTKHCELEDWYCYNDETATKSKPGNEEYCNAYILFYKKQGKQLFCNYVEHYSSDINDQYYMYKKIYYNTLYFLNSNLMMICRS